MVERDGDPVFLCRKLLSFDHGGLRFLDAQRWDTPLGTALKVYMGRNSDVEGLRTKPGADVQLRDFVKLDRSHLIHGTAPAGEGAVQLELLGTDTISVPTAQPEPHLFDDLNVLVAQRHLESAEQVVEWLRFHMVHRDMTGAVILDRAGPFEAGQLQEALAKAVEDLPALKRLALVSGPLPLGREDHAAAGDPALAKRAKDHDFKPDPWRAPLAEHFAFDILKTRFLTRAGAVIALDPCDMLSTPSDGIPAFEIVRQSHTGMMPVTGQAIFPWRVRKNTEPVFGDHVCRSDPPVRAPVRWAIAPKRAGSQGHWLPGNIPGMAALADEVIIYDRAMSIHAPKAEIATLVRKELLTLDAELNERAREVFNAKPVQPPEPSTKQAPARAKMEPPTGRVLIVTCMKNEGPFILEWLAYHRMIGVDDFLIYTNDCDDGTTQLLDLLAKRGLVQRRDNPFRDTGAKPQHAALAAAKTEDVTINAGWIISMDVDEFINVHVGANRLPDLFEAVDNADLISMTWRLFGNSDIAKYQDRPVIEQFTRCAPHLIRRPHQAWGFKTIFRNSNQFEHFGVHRPRKFLGGSARWVNGSGKRMPDNLFKTGWRSQMDTWGYEFVTLNHYSLRSAESFLVKRQRGRVNHVARDQGEAYWFRMNNNDEQDLSIQRHVQGVKEAMQELMSDPEIAAAHQACVKAHRDRIAQLQKNAEFAALFDQITSERFQKLSRMHRHFGMNVFLSGPSVVPDRVFEPELPSNFFFNTARPAGKATD